MELLIVISCCRRSRLPTRLTSSLQPLEGQADTIWARAPTISHVVRLSGEAPGAQVTDTLIRQDNARA